MALFEVKNISKSFRKDRKLFKAVDNVSFTIEEGECLGLVGESGCGKSTTAAIIARLLKEDSGTVIFDGKEINSGLYLKPAGQGMQMIFQNPQDSFDPRDTLLEGVMQGAAAYKIYDKAELKEKAYELLDYVGLKRTYAGQKTSSLSGGECQRAAIARALICSPKLLICDEATSALDVLVQAQIVELLKKMKRETNMSMLFITHDIPLSAALCDRIAVMSEGKIAEIGDAQKILNHPDSEPTKNLIESVLPLTRKGKR